MQARIVSTRGFWSSTLLALLLALLTALPTACRAGARSSQAGFPTYEWEPIGLSGGGGMFSPAISPIDPDLMMINCDMSGAYLTNDGGRHWTMIHHLQLSSSTWCRPGFSPKDANVVYACDGGTGRLKMTRDRGLHWDFVGNFSPTGAIWLDPDDPSLMLAGTGESVAVSRDAGLTWTTVSGPKGRVVGLFIDRTSPASGRVLLAATEQGVWRSDDGGATWAQKTRGLPSAEVRAFAGGADPKSGTVRLYCSVPSVNQNGTFTGGLYRSRDRGETWESAMGAGLNTDTKTYDEWADGPIAQYTHVLTTDTKPLTVYAFNTSTGFWPPHNPGVFRSDDGGATWRQTMYMDPRFPECNRQPDYFTSTQHRSDQAGAFGAAIANSDPERVMHLGGICFITRNGGKSWDAAHTSLAPGQTPAPGAAWLCNGLVITTTWHYYIDPFDPNRHYIAYTDIGLALSRDAGKSWIWWPEKTRPPWTNTTYELAFDPQTPGKLWGAFSDTHDIPNENVISGRHGANYPGGVALSLDHGMTWTPLLTGLPRKACTSIVLDPKSPKGARTLYASFFDDGVYKSTDDGKTWVKKSQGLGAPEDMRVYRVVLHRDGTLFASITAKRQGRTYVTQGPGLYRSRDGGENWQPIATTAGLLWPKDFAVDPNNSQVIFIGAARAGESQGGLYRTKDGGATWKRVLDKGPQHFGAYFHPARPGWVYATLTEGAPGDSLWLSTDGGDTWKPLQNFPFDNTQRVEFDPKDPNTIYVTTFGSSIQRGRAK